MIGELAELGEQPRRVVLLAHAGPAGDEHHVGVVARHRVADPLRDVRQDLEGQRLAAVSRDEAAQHDGVAVHDLRAAGHRARGQQLVSGHDQPHAGPAYALDLAATDRREQTRVLGPQASAAREHGVAA